MIDGCRIGKRQLSLVNWEIIQFDNLAMLHHIGYLAWTKFIIQEKHKRNIKRNKFYYKLTDTKIRAIFRTDRSDFLFIDRDWMSFSIRCFLR